MLSVMEIVCPVINVFPQVIPNELFLPLLPSGGRHGAPAEVFTPDALPGATFPFF